MRTRRRNEPVPAPDDHPMLFEVEVEVPGSGTDEEASSARCEVCNGTLRSERSVSAGVGPTCAAKIGRAVIASTRRPKGARRRQVPDAA